MVYGLNKNIKAIIVGPPYFIKKYPGRLAWVRACGKKNNKYQRTD